MISTDCESDVLVYRQGRVWWQIETSSDFGGGPVAMTYENGEAARRLVACANACLGVPTQMLEESFECGHNFATLIAASQDWKSQYDEILNALRPFAKGLDGDALREAAKAAVLGAEGNST